MTNLTLIIHLQTAKSIRMDMDSGQLPRDAFVGYEVRKDVDDRYLIKITRTVKNLTPRGVSEVLDKAVSLVEGVSPKYVAHIASKTSGDEMEIFIGVTAE